MTPPSQAAPLRSALMLLVCAGLAMFFVHAATVHARRVNTFKARGDQSGYLMDAENVYANVHGRQPRTIIGERNRMPMYAGYLALFYDPAITDPQFFEIAKIANIYLAACLLALSGVVLWWHLPPLPAFNLLGIAAFGWFVYKAGYAQSELLFYALFFFAFLACWHLLRARPSPKFVALGALAGALCALAYLTKASIPPFIAVFLVAFGAQAVTSRRPSGAHRTADAGTAWSIAALAMFVVVFLAVLSPYLATNKREFGRYFYNVNSTFYVWYDDWAQASGGTIQHGDGVHWPDMPAAELPSAGRYLRQHTVAQIAARTWSGLQNMAVVSYRTYDYFGYVMLFTTTLLAVAVTRWRLVRQMLLDHAWLVTFLAAYAAIYALAIAFYFPISGTGTARFLIGHLLPYFFVLTHVLSRSRLAEVEWTVGRRRLSLLQFHQLVLLLLIVDIWVRTWPRLMTTYGGF